MLIEQNVYSLQFQKKSKKVNINIEYGRNRKTEARVCKASFVYQFFFYKNVALIFSGYEHFGCVVIKGKFKKALRFYC